MTTTFYEIKRPRLMKVRGWKKKQRATVKVSDITPEGFRLRTFGEEYYISREKYPRFKDATHREIQDVRLFPCSTNLCESEDRFDHLRWESLGVDLGIRLSEPHGLFPICVFTFEQ